MRRAVLASLLGAGAVGCRGSASNQPDAEPETAAALVISVAAELERLDHPVALEPITVEVRPAQDIAEGMDDLLELAVAPTYFDGMLVLRRAFGIEPAYGDAEALRAEIAAMKTPALSAFYAPQRRALVLDDAAPLDADLEAAVARALVHAFQDQRMGGLIGSLYAPDAPAEEARVRQCMLEGHAAFLAARLDHRAQDGSAAFPGPARLVGTDADVPCPEGARFVADVFAGGGWPAVLAAVSSPPASSEMLLHADKRDVDFPTRVELPPWPEAQLGPAAVLRDDTMGELNIQRLLIERGLETGQAKRAATGWDGDHLRIYALQRGGNAVLWRTLWDREEDGAQFRRALSPRKGAGPMAWRVAHRGRLVQAVAAADDATAIALRDTLGGVVPPVEDPTDVTSTVAAEASM